MAFATRASLSLSRAAVAAPKAGSRRAAPVACAPVETVEAATSEAEAMPAPPAPETFGEIMNFSSYGPELFNGRIAQVAFLAAIGAEASTHETLMEQVSAHTGALVFASALITLASLMPRVAGGTTAKPSGEESGMWKASTEMLNGRAAMLGLVALGVTEAISGHSFL